MRVSLFWEFKFWQCSLYNYSLGDCSSMKFMTVGCVLITTPVAIHSNLCVYPCFYGTVYKGCFAPFNSHPSNHQHFYLSWICPDIFVILIKSIQREHSSKLFNLSNDNEDEMDEIKPDTNIALNTIVWFFFEKCITTA